MNAPQGLQPAGPITLIADAAVTIAKVGAGVLVKRTATGCAVCGAGDQPIGVQYENCALGDPVAVYPLRAAIHSLIVSADGNLATIGTAVVPDTGGAVKAGANTAATGTLITNDAANVGEVIHVLAGA